jgi:hypothetical protein
MTIHTCHEGTKCSTSWKDSGSHSDDCVLQHPTLTPTHASPELPSLSDNSKSKQAGLSLPANNFKLHNASTQPSLLAYQH